jgi:two-component system cell cycle sensor histidine kinase/response regulator CckA
LSVTYGIVQEHGGILSCESAQGEGTKFRLVLPMVSLDPPGHEATAPAAVQPG